MRAVVCKTWGPPESLVIEDLPDLVPEPGKVVVGVRAAGINFPDVLMIQNKYQNKPPLPFIPGGEASGVIAAIGAGVRNWAVGDRCMVNIVYGTFAEQVMVEPDRLFPIPRGMDNVQAAALLIAHGTACHALCDRGRLRAGETVLVLGAAGGVGLAAVEVAKAMGATVIACASNAEKLAVCRAHGADHAIDYTREDLRAAVKAITNGRGLDVVVDPVGGRSSELALRDMAWGGRFLVIGFASGEIPKVALNLALIKGCELIGVRVGVFSTRDPAGYRANLARLARWFEDGRIKPHVSATYPMERVAEALEAMAQRAVSGKIVLTI